jgi:hypothetical protein
MGSKSPCGGGCVSMKTAAEYRVMADKCFKWARDTYMDEARESPRMVLTGSPCRNFPRPRLEEGPEPSARIT